MAPPATPSLTRGSRWLPAPGLGLLLAWAVLGPAFTGCRPPPGPRTSRPLDQQAYLWQREWTPAVGSAVTQHARQFSALVVLGGEISWPQGRGEWTPAVRDPRTLQASGRPVGIALRVGSFAGPFDPGSAPAGFLRRTARNLVAEVRREGLEPAEFQLDFDCAESRLAGYRRWLEGLRADLAPLRVTFTALPSWLKHRDFADLARAADGFILQVHSVARPKSSREPFDLCDPVAAHRWVEQASVAGVPFRVALPTYSYLVAFDAADRFLGASAEGPPPARPAGAVLREMGADPIRLAQLVAEWSADRPALMQGVIWYRLPVAGDRLNWRWTTLESVMAGRAPSPRLIFAMSRPGPLLVELRVANEGSADHSGPLSVRARWPGARLVARDAIQGFAAEPGGTDSLLFTNPICRLPAGEAKTIGWLRFDTEASVELIP